MNKNYFEREGGDMNCLHKILTKSVNSLKNQWSHYSQGKKTHTDWRHISISKAH